MPKHLLLVCFVLFNGFLLSQDHPIYNIDQFEKIRINENSDLDDVRSIEEDGNGYLWLGIREVLYRFDGDRFTTVPLPKSLGNRIRQIKSINSDTILLATTRGLGIVNTKTFSVDTRFYDSESEENFLQDNMIRWIIRGHKQTYWIYTRTAIHLLDRDFQTVGSHYFEYHPDIIDANPTRPVCFPISDNQIIIESPIRKIGEENTWHLLDIANKSFVDYSIPVLDSLRGWNIFQTDPGKCVLVSHFTTSQRRIFYYFDIATNELKELLEYDPSDRMVHGDYQDLKVSPEGKAINWYKTGYFFDPISQSITEEYRNFRPWTRFLKMKNGIVYACNSGGLYRLSTNSLNINKHQKFDSLFKDRKFNDDISDFLNYKEKLYIATHGESIYALNTNTDQLANIQLSELGQSGMVWNLRVHSENEIWIGTQDGLFVYNVTSGSVSRLQHKDLPDGINSMPIPFQFVDSKGLLWMSIGFGNGLLQYNFETDRFKHYLFDKNKFPLRSARAIQEDKSGNLWMGYGTGGGLVRWDRKKDTFEKIQITKESGIATDRINTLLFDNNDDLWLGTRHGLYRYRVADNRFEQFSIEEGILDEFILSLYQDKNDRIWVGTNRGLSIYDLKSERFLNLDKQQGIPGQSVGEIKPWDMEGQYLFVGATEGFALMNIDNVRYQNDDLQLYIEPIKVNGEFVDQDLTNPVRLNYRQNNIAISFGVVSHKEGRKNQYYYKINEVDTVWNKLNTKGELLLVGLGPGSYNLSLKTCVHGAKCYEDDSLNFKILPPFWRTWWFTTLLILGAIALTALFYNNRIQNLKRIDKVRQQISADLHDDVGASISSVRILTDFLSSEKDADQRPIIDAIKQQSSHIGEVLEEIVWNVNPKNDRLSNIVARMQQFANETLEGADITIEWQVEINLGNRLIEAEKRKALYLFFKEVINNIAKHSKAAHAWIVIGDVDGHLKILVKDDGLGYDTEKEYLSNGINSIKMRANYLDAQLNLNSTLGKGSTTVLRFKL